MTPAQLAAHERLTQATTEVAYAHDRYTVARTTGESTHGPRGDLADARIEAIAAFEAFMRLTSAVVAALFFVGCASAHAPPAVCDGYNPNDACMLYYEAAIDCPDLAWGACAWNDVRVTSVDHECVEALATVTDCADIAALAAMCEVCE